MVALELTFKGAAMHQASILFSALVMIMGGAWLAIHELTGQEAAAEPAAIVAQAQ